MQEFSEDNSENNLPSRYAQVYLYKLIKQDQINNPFKSSNNQPNKANRKKNKQNTRDQIKNNLLKNIEEAE